MKESGAHLESVIETINKSAENIKEEDIDNLSEKVLEHFKSKINYLSFAAYQTNSSVASGAFLEQSHQTIKNVLNTFLLKNKLWQQKRDIGPYIAKSLNVLSDRIRFGVVYSSKQNVVPICPACKSISDNKEMLVYEGKSLRCINCTREVERLESSQRTSNEEFEYRIRKIFSYHSRKGYKCPGCKKFIPLSFIGKNIKVSCPYDDCIWFGLVSEMEPMAHQMGCCNLTSSLNISTLLDGGNNKTQYIDLVDSQEVTADILFEANQKYNKDLEIIKTVLRLQKSKIADKNFKKKMMYQAFEDLLEQDCESMFSYLTRDKILGERPIQSIIFQRYIQLIENRLPIVLEDGSEIYSLNDPKLELFLGVSEYQGFVKDSLLIGNNTREVYVGAKCNGPCFIGLLCDVVDVNTGKSLLSQVEHYTFSHIKMKEGVIPGTVVKVIHFRIPPHYEMGAMVLLQRTRKRIVESIDKKVKK